MAKDKLRRFAEFLNFPNCFDYPKHLKGKWKQEYFKNNNPIVLELACGKGEYTVALAAAFPEKNFIGIDIKSNRMWVGARMALAAKQENAAFARLIIEKLEEHFEKGEVSEIWITFPDPFPKDRHEKHRLTHPRFLKVYQEVLPTNGLINFKTDDDGLFNYTEELFKQLGIVPIQVVRDVHGTEEADAYVRDISTHYEKLFRGRGRTIKFMKFLLPAQLPEVKSF